MLFLARNAGAPTSSGCRTGSGRPSFCRAGCLSPITPFRAGESIQFSAVPRRRYMLWFRSCIATMCAGIGIPSRLPEPYMFHKLDDIRLHIAERSRDNPGVVEIPDSAFEPSPLCYWSYR
jgi:hypothetical protein